MPKSHTPTLAVYGATAYTAQQHLLPYLVSHPDYTSNQFHLILAGRNPEKLATVNGLLPRTGRDPEIVELRLDDEGGVEHLVKRVDVLVNFAGPYQLHNAQTLIAACVKHGTHYLDLCGEVNFLAKIIPQYDFAGSQTGSVLIPMCGFESAPGDLTVYHALRTLQSHAGRNTTIGHATNFYDIAGGVSGGTMASMAASLESQDKNLQGEWSLVPSSWGGQKKQTPAVRLYYKPPVRVPGAPAAGAWFVGSMLNLTTIRRSWFLSRMDSVVLRESPQAQAADSEKEPRHGEQVTFEESLMNMTPLRVTGMLTAYVYSMVMLLVIGVYASSSWIRDALAAWVPQPGEGPSKEVCESGHTSITTVSRSDDNKYAIITKYKGAGDPGYSHTGKVLAEAALSLLLAPPEGTALPPLARTGGFLTPSTGLGMVLIERLRANGVATIDSEIVELEAGETGTGESKKLR